MNEAHRRAVELARFYFRRTAEAAGAQRDGGNDTEIEMLVSSIIDAARDGQREDLAAAHHPLVAGVPGPGKPPAEGRICELENRMRDAFALLRGLDRLRPTCVICTDATADRQTSRGPACTDCVGDLPDDGADPDRPETWSFGEAPLIAARPDGDPGQPEVTRPPGLPECGRIEAHEPHEYRMFLGARAHCGGMP